MRLPRPLVLVLLLPAGQVLCQQIISEHVFDVSHSRNSPPAANAAFDVPFRFQERFPTAWRRRNVSTDPLVAGAQNILGTIYQTESGTFNPAFPSVNGLSQAGLADNGTRLILRFSGIPQGVRILAPVQLGGFVRTVADADGNGPYSPVAATVTIGPAPFAPVVADQAGNAHVVWEAVQTDVTTIEQVSSGVIFSYDAGAGTGSIWMSATLAPSTEAQQNPASRPAFARTPPLRVKVAHFRSGQRFIDRTALPSARTGQQYSAAIGGSLGSPGFYVGQPFFEMLSGELPPGLSLSQAGAITGTPQATGSYDFRVRILSTGGGVTVESPVLNITVLDPVRVTPFPDAVEDLLYSSPFNVSGGRAPYQFAFHGTIGPVPSLFPSNRGASFPHLAGFAAPAGSYGYDVTVTDAEGKSLRTTVPLRILPATGRPTFREPAPDQVTGVQGATISWNGVVGAVSHDVEVVEPTVFSSSFGEFVSVGRSSTDRTAFAMNVPAQAGNSVFVGLPQPRGFDGSVARRVPGYEARVRGCFDASRTNCTPWSFRRFLTAPAAPFSNPVLLSPGFQVLPSTTVQFRWQPVADATYYEVQVGIRTAFDIPSPYGLSNSIAYAIAVTETNTVVTVPSGTWTWSVRACSLQCRETIARGDFDVAINTAPRWPPSNVQVQTPGPGSVSVSWQPVTGMDFYEALVIQPTSGPGGGALTVASARTSQTSATFPAPAGAASVLVRSCSSFCGDWTSPVAVNVPGPSPSRPVIAEPLPAQFVNGKPAFFSWSRIAGDNGSNTLYRLYIQDMFRRAPALDVLTRNNFYAAALVAGGTRYDAVVIANPGTPSAVQSAPAGFQVSGETAQAPTLVSPTHQSQVRQGMVQLGWSPTPNASAYEFYLAPPSGPPIRGVASGNTVQVPLSVQGGAATRYNVIMRSCPSICQPGSEEGWGPWSDQAGAGVLSFELLP